jgi:hypothetical protein
MRAVCLAFVTLFAFAQIERTPDTDTGSRLNSQDFAGKLHEVRFELHVENGRFSGNGAPVLQRAIAEAKYVLIGEDHITHEIPQFTTVVCDVMGRDLSAMAVESGPKAAEFVSRTLGGPTRLKKMATLLHRYPDSVAFLNIREENDLAAAQALRKVPASISGVSIRSLRVRQGGYWIRFSQHTPDPPRSGRLRGLKLRSNKPLLAQTRVAIGRNSSCLRPRMLS